MGVNWHCAQKRMGVRYIIRKTKKELKSGLKIFYLRFLDQGPLLSLKTKTCRNWCIYVIFVVYICLN